MFRFKNLFLILSSEKFFWLKLLSDVETYECFQ